MRHEKIIVPDRGAAEPISAGAAVLAGKKVAPDAINLLIMDHLEARSFFAWYREATEEAEKLRVADKLMTALTVHMQVEEELFYPAAEAASGDKPKTDHARHEHGEAKQVIRQLRERSTVDDSYDSLVLRLQELIEHHVMEEETSYFPEIRQTDLDLYELGRLVSGRRVELLFDMTGRTQRDGATHMPSEMDVAMTGNVGTETMAVPVDPEEARKLFLVGLRNAHATEMNCRTMVQRQLDRLENYPKLKARLEMHQGEVERQIERLDQILAQQGESSSALKDAAMSMSANMSAMMNAAAGDEILKNSMANAAMAQFEIAAYRSLILMGEACGEVAAVRLLQQSLSEERAMAAWLEENLPGTVIAHMQLRGQPGVDASH
jgi:ferritin-like metal-binding protein YciE